MPPEMMHSKGVGKAADVYQLGAVLYELIVGFPPYYSDNIKELYERIKSAELKLPKYISEEGTDLLSKLLERELEKRITLESVKAHEFFKDIDWQALMRKEVEPPVHLKKEEEDDDEETRFLRVTENHFRDRDYTQDNLLSNRLKQFTFIAGGPNFDGPQPPLE